MAAAAPDPDRLGGVGWLERTRGHLTRQERRLLVGAILRTHASHARGLARLALGRRADGATALPEPPDSSLARAAEAACVETLSPALAAHSWRTWLYGRALAAVDRTRLDPELFYVAALLHDAGLAPAVPGEDFTLRSAERAREVMEAEGVGPADVQAVRDAIAVHILPGVGARPDGELGAYLQAGAMLDLVGLRAVEVPAATVAAVNERHPRGRIVPELVRAARDEASAVPDGRFALAARSGFLLAVRTARGVT